MSRRTLSALLNRSIRNTFAMLPSFRPVRSRHNLRLFITKGDSHASRECAGTDVKTPYYQMHAIAQLATGAHVTVSENG